MDKTFEEDIGGGKFRRKILFRVVGDPNVVPPHSHEKDHVTHCVQGKVAVFIADTATVLTKGESRLVPAKTLHSAIAFEPNSRMVCEFGEYVEGQEHPKCVIGQWVDV